MILKLLLKKVQQCLDWEQLFSGKDNTKKKIILLFLFFSGVVIFSQENPDNGNINTPKIPTQGSDNENSVPILSPDIMPEEYTDEEFPKWLRDLRRAEVITAGIYPIALFFTSLGFSTCDYISSGYDSELKPALFGGNAESYRTDSDKKIILLATLGVSMFYSLIDYLLGLKKEEIE